MSYDASQLSSSALYRVRFTLQDTDENNEFLLDEEINYLLGISTSENSAILTAATRMLGQFSQYTRQRESQIETYAGDIFKQWRQYLTDLVKELSGGSSTSYMILGGTVASEVDRVKSDSQSVGNGYELGYIDNQRTWLTSGSIGNVTENPFRLK